MLASDLIRDLQKLIEKYGDLDVAYIDDGGGYGSFSVGGIYYDPAIDESRDDQFIIE